MTYPQTRSTIDPIRSDQRGPHPDLSALVQKHQRSIWRKPTPEHTRVAVDTLRPWLEQHAGAPIILDSFCGTGMSTQRLAETHPDALVLGVDKSADRLGKHVRGKGHYCLIRAECEPLWRELVNAGITVAAHYLLYPNPWPKAAHLKRRIHGHPAFPLLASLGGTLELRSNWQLYVDEFAAACHVIGIAGTISRLEVAPQAGSMTLFERKYAGRGQALWRFRGASKD